MAVIDVRTEGDWSDPATHRPEMGSSSPGVSSVVTAVDHALEA